MTGTGIGGGIGAILGSIIPGVGTVIGASAGAALGGNVGAGQDASDKANKDQKKMLALQGQQAKDLQTQILEQPKKVAPDDILAKKNKMLNAMRLGIASTMTGAGMGAGAGGKQKLGQ